MVIPNAGRTAGHRWYRAAWHHREVTVQQVPPRLVFRIPSTAVLGALLAALAATPFAFAAPWLFLVYLVPLSAIALVLRLRTTADGEKLVARTLLHRRVVAWSDIRSLRVSERSWVRAVVADGKELPLPTVRTRHLPALALISGGRLDDPTETPSAEAEPKEDTE